MSHIWCYVYWWTVVIVNEALCGASYVRGTGFHDIAHKATETIFKNP